MTRPRSSGRKARFTSGDALLVAALSVVLFLACCGQAAETGGPQTEREAAQLKVKGVNQTAEPQPAAQHPPYAPDEVLVKFKPGTGAKTIERILAELKLEPIREFSSPNLFLIQITDGTPVEAIIDLLQSCDAVKYAEPNYVVKATQ